MSLTERNKLIFVGSFPPYASNIGDHAQTYAIDKYLTANFTDYDIHRFYRTEVWQDRWRRVMSDITSDDLIFISSSGDFGTRYKGWHDTTRTQIFKLYYNNRIVQLPTTVWYGNDSDQKLKDRKTWYSKKHLVLCRELDSYNIAKSVLACQVEWFPDFVFYLDNPISPNPEEKVMLNLRTDGERSISASDTDLLYQELVGTYHNVVHRDFHKLPYDITPDIREQYLTDLFTEYRTYKLIVTDMMHAMIFAVINKIPCVAIDDAIPHKLSGYRKILNNSVAFAKSPESVLECAEDILNRYKPNDLSHYFSDFRGMVLDYTNGLS